jgi:hypothetical protein
MQTIRPLVLTVAAMTLAGSSFAMTGGAASRQSPAPKSSSTQTTKASSTPSGKAKAASSTTLVASGKIVQFDPASQKLTLSTSKGEEQFTVSPAAHLKEASKTIKADELTKLAGHQATVRYKEAGGEKNVESVHVAASNAKATKG